MEVSEVKQIRRKVYLQIGNERIVLPVAVYRERPISVGDEIDMDEFDQWLLLRQYRPALDYAVSLLAARAHATHELETKLLRAGYRPVTVEMVLYKLSSNRLTDDAEFARQWVQARANRKLGTRRIAQELRQKGISEEDAEVALSALDDEKQMEQAVSLAEKGLRKAKAGEDPRKTKQRVSAMLARRGFDYDTVREAILIAEENLKEASN